MSTARRLIGVACCISVISACTSAATLPVTERTPVATTSEPAVSDQRVFVEGDSLTSGASGYLPALLVPQGWTVTIDDQVGRTTAVGIGILAERASEIGGTLVVALGTNDLPDPKLFSVLIDQVMNIALDRTVIWVTVARVGWDGLDEALMWASIKWANLHVIDWRPVIAAHPDMLASDGIHLTPAGYQLRAQFIATAVETVTFSGRTPS